MRRPMGTSYLSREEYEKDKAVKRSQQIISHNSDDAYIKYHLESSRRLFAWVSIAEAFNEIPDGFWIAEVVKKHATDRAEQFLIDCDYKSEFVDSDMEGYVKIESSVLAENYDEMFAGMELEKVYAAKFLTDMKAGMEDFKRLSDAFYAMREKFVQ